MGNVLRDNKVILKSALDGYKRIANSVLSGIFVAIVGRGVRLNFTYKDFSFYAPINGIRFDLESDDIVLAEKNDKAIICVNVYNVFKFKRLGIRALQVFQDIEYSTITSFMQTMGACIYDDMGKHYPELLNELCTNYSTKYGKPCKTQNDFGRLFEWESSTSFEHMLDDFIDTITLDNIAYKLSKTVYQEGNRIGICCYDFPKNVIIYPKYDNSSISVLTVLSHSANNDDVRFKSISNNVGKAVGNRSISIHIPYMSANKKIYRDTNTGLELLVGV